MPMKPWSTPLPNEDKDYTIRCTHQKLWPPPLVKLNVNIRAMWANGEIEQHDFQQIETWEKVCGLLEMGEKCLTCPLAKVDLPVPGAGQNKVNVEALGPWLQKRAALHAKASLVRRRAEQRELAKIDASEPEPPAVSTPPPEKPPAKAETTVDPETGEELDLDKLLND